MKLPLSVIDQNAWSFLIIKNNYMDNLSANVFSSQLTSSKNIFESHPTLGWILFGIVVLGVIFVAIMNSVSAFDILRSKILKPWAKSKKFNKLVRSAKKYDIRGYVNKAVGELKTELPLGWIREIDIEWVENEDKEDFFHNNEVVIRVRPYGEQDRNFVNVTYQFLNRAFFPKVKKVIPEVQRESAILYFSERIAQKRGKNTVDAFVDYIFEPAIDKESKIVEYLGRYKNLDNKGLFSGTFLREIQHIAEEIRTIPQRKMMGNELSEVLKHLEEFSKAYDVSQNKGGEQISEYLWSRNGVVSKYGILLVAHPEKAMSGDSRQYVRRAQRFFDEGAERLYVLGARNENGFADGVVRAIASGTNYQLVENFDLYKDYRGNPGGVGAVFIKREVQND